LRAKQLLRVACSQKRAYEASVEQRKDCVARNRIERVFVPRAANGSRHIISLRFSRKISIETHWYPLPLPLRQLDSLYPPPYHFLIRQSPRCQNDLRPAELLSFKVSASSYPPIQPHILPFGYLEPERIHAQKIPLILVGTSTRPRVHPWRVRRDRYTGMRGAAGRARAGMVMTARMMGHHQHLSPLPSVCPPPL